MVRGIEGDRDIISMPVVVTLANSYHFRVDFVYTEDRQVNPLVFDNRGLPWLYLLDSQCFVRANSRWVEPMY